MVNAEWSLAAAGAPRVVNAEWSLVAAGAPEGKSRCLSMEDVHAMLPLYQSETGTVLEPADINPVAVRHNRANIPKSRGRGCFLYASRTEKKTGSYVAICA